MKKSIKLFSILFLSSFAIAATYVSTIWTVDKAHSSITFDIRHFFSDVTGSFDNYEADIKFDPQNLDESMIDVTIMVASVNTKNERRDGHLRTADFFNAEKYPHITFKSDRIVSNGDGKFTAEGKLTIKDVTKDFDLPFTLLGVMDNPRGGKIAGISSEFVILRNEFGVGTGDYVSDKVIGNEVKTKLNLELNAK
ncbi:YceI family protein [Balneola vulgaris]|uniref:YceI family protein n=1 Tax=Balneola vulgaris TaxID=287535 RepID=UPI000373997C|nr:YceI family protein [Balneola vulgaris]